MFDAAVVGEAESLFAAVWVLSTRERTCLAQAILRAASGPEETDRATEEREAVVGSVIVIAGGWEEEAGVAAGRNSVGIVAGVGVGRDEPSE